MMTEQPRRAAFAAFGTSVDLVMWAASDRETKELLDIVQGRAKRWERLFSRFLPESELSRVNRETGQWVPVSGEFLEVVAQAREGYIATGGRFDPTILSSLERAGYDRPFVDIATCSFARPEEAIDSHCQSATMLDIDLDESASSIRLPAGLRIDLGGIAKGAFVDSVDDLMIRRPGVILDAGGDIRVWGTPGEDDVWRVGVQHPGVLDRDIAELELQVGASVAIATSSTRTRSWGAGARQQNHLIDPRDRRPVSWSTPNVTVVAETVTDAEIQAKSVLISIARGEKPSYTTADFVLVAHEDGRYETITPYAAVA
jgi:thiamine biosynthesis lipoprotein